jgi:hypothetical protein
VKEYKVLMYKIACKHMSYLAFLFFQHAVNRYRMNFLDKDMHPDFFYKKKRFAA